MVWAIGDIHGCFKQFKEILKKVDFTPERDKLWIVGDMINRGDDSLEVLKYIYSIRDSVNIVLGNHEISLIASYLGLKKSNSSIEPILNHKMAKRWISWLREQPFMVYDKELNIVMSHAGIAPIFNIESAFHWNKIFQKKLKSKDAKHWLSKMIKKESSLSYQESKEKYALASFIRMRFCYKDGSFLDFEQKGKPTKELYKDGFIPWFEIKHKKLCKKPTPKIVFGHWSTLGYFENSSVCCLDSGCHWGRELTIKRLDCKKREIVQIKCPSLERGKIIKSMTNKPNTT